MRVIDSTNGRYAVTSDGSVFSLLHGSPRQMKPTLCRDGYMRAQIRMADGSKRMRAVHRLVGEVFCQNPDNLPQINHKDGCKTNNQASNLEWVTHTQNMRHAVKTGLHRPPIQKDQEIVAIARSMRSRGIGLKEIASAVGRSISTVHGYVSGDSTCRI